MYIKPQSPLSLTNDVSTEIYNSKGIYLFAAKPHASIPFSLPCLCAEWELAPLCTGQQD